MKRLLTFTIFLMVFSLLLLNPYRTPLAVAEEYPSKPITWIVPMSPGGGFDTYSRGVGQIMEKYLGQPVVIKNMPGAGNRTGTNAIYRARPDGYTIGIINVPGMAAGQMLMKTRFDLDKFTWLGGVSIEKYVMATSSKSPYYTVEDLKKSKTPINVGVTGKGATAYTVAIIGMKSFDVPFRLVSGYGGSSEAIVGAIRGDVAIVNYSLTSILPHVKSGDLRPIIVFTKERDPFYPNTPCVTEVGKGELAALGVPRLIAAPPKTPKDRYQKLAKALEQTLKDPQLIAWSKKAKRPIEPISAEQGKRLQIEIMKTYKSYAKVLKQFF
jgi:tripartite-type tricarboxylate transporter receptor subunit TctC